MIKRYGFTLLELIVVLTIIGLAISLVALRMHNISPSDEALVRMFVIESLKIAKDKKTDIVITSQGGSIVSSDGRRLDIKAKGFCVVKPSGKITLCQFELKNGEIWITDVDY